ncbi:MAG: TlpA family protein disulfide reductase [Chloroflexi bacterium]|nr:TlpA family protein disulfide reductase [Chloroflexota bacterium]
MEPPREITNQTESPAERPGLPAADPLDAEGPVAPQGHRRTLVLVAVLIPVSLIAALLIWATVRSGGRAGGGTVNDELGEVKVDPRPAPAFRLPDLDGSELDLESLRGKVVMVDFWASWCPPCQREAPVLAEVYERYRGRPVEFLGISIWDKGQDARSFAERFQIQYPVAVDHEGRIAIDYGVTGIPEKFFVDREGRLVRRFVGPMDEPTLVAILDRMLAPAASR